MPEILIRKSMKASYVLLGVRASLVTGQGQCRCGGTFHAAGTVTGKQFDCPKAHQEPGAGKNPCRSQALLALKNWFPCLGT
jgi:hypothetical protein